MKKFIPNMLAVLSVLFITLVFLPQTAMAKAWKAYVVEDEVTFLYCLHVFNEFIIIFAPKSFIMTLQK